MTGELTDSSEVSVYAAGDCDVRDGVAGAFPRGGDNDSAYAANAPMRVSRIGEWSG